MPLGASLLTAGQLSLALMVPLAAPAAPIPPLQVVMDDNYPPYAFRDDNGKLQGIAVDEWRLWQTKTGVPVQLHGLDWGQALQAMKAGRFDVIDTIFETSEREAYLDFTPPYARIPVPIFFDQHIAGINGLTSLRGFPVGVKAGDAAEDLLRQRGERHLMVFSNYEAIVTAASQHKLGVFIMDEPPALYYLNQQGLQNDFKCTAPVNFGEFHRAVRKGNLKLLAQVETGFAAITPAEEAAIRTRWQGRSLFNAVNLRDLVYLGSGALAAILALAGGAGYLGREVKRRTAALAESEERLRALGDNLPQGVIYQLIGEPGGARRFLHLSAGVKRIHGLPVEAVLKQADLLYQQIVPEDRARFAAAERVSLEQLSVLNQQVRIRNTRGETRWLQLFSAPRPLSDGRVLWDGLQLDITAQKQHEWELERLNRLYAALGHINQAIAHARSRAELFQKVCELICVQGGFRMAWIGWHNPATGWLEPVAAHGDDTAYLQTITVRPADPVTGSGPAGTAFREARVCLSNDIAQDPAMQAWHEPARQRGFLSMAALPIRLQGVVRGTLTVYASETGIFQDKEVALMTEAAGDISFALDNFAREAERQEAQVVALQEAGFSRAMLESMPGIVYFYNEQGRFLRWNRNFETVSGYSAAEIARLHPLDFFRAEEKPLLAGRIAEVFSRGESVVEAGFVAKSGRVTPYLFTGRRLVFDSQPCLIGLGIDISERLAAERDRRHLAAIVNSSEDAIISETLDGVVTTWNHGAEQLFGYSRAEAVGRAMHLLIPPGRAGEEREFLHRTAAGERTLHFETVRLRKDGVPVHVSITISPILDSDAKITGVSKIARDITGRRQAEELLREVQARNAIVIEHLREGLIMMDPQRGFLQWNPAALRMLDLATPADGHDPAEDLAGAYEIATLDGQVLAIEQWPLRRLRRGEAMDGCELRVRRLGTDWERILSYAGLQVAYGEGRTIAFMTLRDVTAQKCAERALRVLNQNLEFQVGQRTAELQSALVRAEAADRIKSAFLATMSHELRTPLNSIIGFTGILLQGLAGGLNAEQEKQLGMVRTSARHLLELINDVLDLSKIEAGQLEIRREPFDLRASLQQVIELMQPLAQKKGLALSATVASSVAGMTGDRRRVEQILLNLLNNAIKFTQKGGITLTADILAGPGSSANPPPGRLRLRVADTGIGIQADDLACLFQPFRQVDSGLARQHEGTGLGLAICRRLATLMGGEITAASQWLQGSEFTVTLPLG